MWVEHSWENDEIVRKLDKKEEISIFEFLVLLFIASLYYPINYAINFTKDQINNIIDKSYKEKDKEKLKVKLKNVMIDISNKVEEINRKSDEKQPKELLDLFSNLLKKISKLDRILKVNIHEDYFETNRKILFNSFLNEENINELINILQKKSELMKKPYKGHKYLKEIEKLKKLEIELEKIKSYFIDEYEIKT